MFESTLRVDFGVQVNVPRPSPSGALITLTAVPYVVYVPPVTVDEVLIIDGMLVPVAVVPVAVQLPPAAMVIADVARTSALML